MTASYSHDATKPSVTPVPKVAATTAPVAALRIIASMIMARNRRQKPAYSPTILDRTAGAACACSALPQIWQYLAVSSSFCFPQSGQNIVLAPVPPHRGDCITPQRPHLDRVEATIMNGPSTRGDPV